VVFDFFGKSLCTEKELSREGQSDTASKVPGAERAVLQFPYLEWAFAPQESASLAACCGECASCRRRRAASRQSADDRRTVGSSTSVLLCLALQQFAAAVVESAIDPAERVQPTTLGVSFLLC
jgi:hypothetical protein